MSLGSSAQFTKLLDFDGAGNGSRPSHDLISDGTFLYGTTDAGGTSNFGTIFKIKPDGSGYVKLFEFGALVNGRSPGGSLISDGTFLYGTTTLGGTGGFGVIYKIKLDGTGFAKIHDFTGAPDGKTPQGSLLFDGTFLYGTTYVGGSNNFGSIYKVKTDGTGYARLLDFAGVSTGRSPTGSLFSDGTFLYGTTLSGGTIGSGTVFKIKPDGTSFAKLWDFGGVGDGTAPEGTLISDGTFLYGMTPFGGVAGDDGTIFKIKPDGTGYVKLMDFSPSAGQFPHGSLVYDGTFLYGMASLGGANNAGTLFRLKSDGTGYTKLIDFSNGTADGCAPKGSLIYDGSFLYGMTYACGASNFGTIFKYSLFPIITNFAPASGTVGSTVTITGSGFDTTPANNIIFFGATQATVTAATPTQVTVTVPTGATYQPISVMVNGLTGFSSKPFLVTFPDGGTIDACSFASPLGFGPDSGGFGVAMGDLDGDGKTDVAVTDYFSNSIRIFRNTSTPGTIDASSFAPSISFGVGINPYKIAIADIDGDGKLDIIASNWNGSTISIFRNTSTVGSLTTSSFAARLDLATGAEPFNISCQDLDGDGKTDIAVGNAGGSAISIWQNIGTPGSITAGSFNPRLDIAGPSSGFTIADMDLDGKPDLIGGYNLGTAVGVSRNVSSPGTLTTGSFLAPVNFSVAAWPEHVVIGDLDADNRPDIVTSSWPGNMISILKNTSTPGTIGAGSFAAKVDISGNGEPQGVWITDYDGDGLPDIGLSNQTSNVSIYKNANTPGTITSASFLPKKRRTPRA